MEQFYAKYNERQPVEMAREVLTLSDVIKEHTRYVPNKLMNDHLNMDIGWYKITNKDAQIKEEILEYKLQGDNMINQFSLKHVPSMSKAEREMY